MLSPRSRRLLLDALRPPPGYSFDRAVGTSYTLDLLALMTAPLAFTFFDWEDDEGRSSADPLALFEALRRHADRIALFCQAGRILVPPSGRLLLHYLESSVFEAAAPRDGGLFHPKVWLLRYRAEDEPVRYRLLCLTRNLTYDRSWDTALVLDGILKDRKNAFAVNHPLSDFIDSLPELAVREVPSATRAGIAEMADEVRRVAFQPPDGFDDFAFHPLGVGGWHRWPFAGDNAARRMLVLSPFLGDGLLQRLVAERRPGVLISRPESLNELELGTLSCFQQVFALHPGADPEDEDDEAPSTVEAAAAPDVADRALRDVFTGLHAKLYVMDDGWNARVWTGSANATDAAFHLNVEFLVELVGKKSNCGIEALLGADEEKAATLRSLLVPFTRPDALVPDETERDLQAQVERIAADVARGAWAARAKETDGLFSLTLELRGPWPELPPDLKLHCRPVTLPAGRAVPAARDQAAVASFDGLATENLTQFFAFEAKLSRGTYEPSTRFVVNVPLEGAPADRRDRILRELLRDSKQVLRLIWLLLSDADISVQDWVDAGSGSGSGSWRAAGTGGFPLLETMLKALGGDPTRLDHVAHLVADLRRTPEGGALLPDGFDSIWEPIWKTREALE